MLFICAESQLVACVLALIQYQLCEPMPPPFDFQNIDFVALVYTQKRFLVLVQPAIVDNGQFGEKQNIPY